MRIRTTLLIAAPVALGLLAAPTARADWHHHDDWHGGGWRGGDWHEHHDHGGDVATGAIIGLGVGALLGGVIASQAQPYYAPPPVVYAPPPPYYGPPGYVPQY